MQKGVQVGEVLEPGGPRLYVIWDIKWDIPRDQGFRIDLRKAFGYVQQRIRQILGKHIPHPELNQSVYEHWWSTIATGAIQTIKEDVRQEYNLNDQYDFEVKHIDRKKQLKEQRENRLEREWGEKFPNRYRTNYTKNGKGQKVHFVWYTQKNVAGYFLTCRIVTNKNGKTKHSQWAAVRTKKAVQRIAERRCAKAEAALRAFQTGKVTQVTQKVSEAAGEVQKDEQYEAQCDRARRAREAAAEQRAIHRKKCKSLGKARAALAAKRQAEQLA